MPIRCPDFTTFGGLTARNTETASNYPVPTQASPGGIGTAKSSATIGLTTTNYTINRANGTQDVITSESCSTTGGASCGGTVTVSAPQNPSNIILAAGGSSENFTLSTTNSQSFTFTVKTSENGKRDVLRACRNEVRAL